MNRNISKAKRRRVYRYLNELRKSGKTNMFGAVPYLVKRFGFNRNDASIVLTDWMRDFSK
jgi:hypothetical protein